jgi:hypothetical protein
VCTGFSEANGSWKISCTLRQYARNRRPPRTVVSSPCSRMSPVGARLQLREQPGDGGLARARLADQRGDPAAAQAQGHVVDRVHDSVPAAQRLAAAAADGKVFGEALGLENGRRLLGNLGNHGESRNPGSSAAGAGQCGHGPGGRSSCVRASGAEAGLRSRMICSELISVGCAGA